MHTLPGDLIPIRLDFTTMKFKLCAVCTPLKKLSFRSFSIALHVPSVFYK